MKRIPSLLVCVFAFVLPWCASTAFLIPNATLEKASADPWPDGWPRHEQAAYLEENGNHFLRQTAVPDKMVMFYQSIPLPKT